eukprot:Hpha_TRINITY_DN11068_c0_g2::TRINITY_DN11068_c0_g2_i1::g.92916::m.92916
MPIDYSKWDNIADSDDETPPPKKEAPPAAAAPDAAEVQVAPSPGVAVNAADGSDLSSAPPLDSPAMLGYYREQMTLPQRMLTLMHLWNSAPQENRAIFLRRLIELIGDVGVSNRIRGGQEVLRDLDPAFYHGVTAPPSWVQEFGRLESTEKKCDIFSQLYTTLPEHERNLVVGALM